MAEHPVPTPEQLARWVQDPSSEPGVLARIEWEHEQQNPREKSAHPLDLSSHVDQLGNIEVFVEVGTKRSPDGTTRRAVLSANDSPARTAGWLHELADDIAAAGKATP